MSNLTSADVPAIRAKVNAGFTFTQIQEEYGLPHYTTIQRFCKRHNISRFSAKVTQSEADDLVDAVKFDAEGTPVREGWGAQKIYDCFAAMGVRVQRSVVRRAMRHRDADGVARRKRHAVVRRVYFAPYANYVWHTDTNMKLVRYGIWIYGTVDGYSRFLLHLVATDNISMRVGGLLHGRSVLQYSVFPETLRVDAGTENNLQIRMQLAMGGGIHVGSSVHNQPIERFWRTCRSHVTERYRVLFLEMENSGELNIADACDLDALRSVYLETIQDECDVFRFTHNRGNKEGRGKPTILFNGGVPAKDTPFTVGDFRHGYGTRLQFSPGTLAERDELVRRMAPQTLFDKYLVTRDANKLLLGEMMRL